MAEAKQPLDEMENQVTKGASKAEPMPKAPNYVPDNASIEDLGGPTPTNSKPDDDSNKLKTPGASFAQSGDPHFGRQGAAGKVQLPGPAALKSTGYGKGANEETESEEEVVAEAPATEEEVVAEEE